MRDPNEIARDTHGPGFLPGDTADTFRWILVPSATVEFARKYLWASGLVGGGDPSAEAALRDIVARWDAAREEIEL